MSKVEFRKDINGLRAIAVISVLLFHFNVNHITGGFVGVDIFFVISGFLMTGILIGTNDIKGIKNFYIARFVRIFPALGALIITTLLLSLLLFTTSDFETFSRNAVSALLFYSNIYFSKHSGYFDTSSHYNLLLHTWSLSVEWQFYILFPLIVLLTKKTRLSLFGIISFLTVLSAALAFWTVYGNKEELFYTLPFRAWELLLGGMIYIASLKKIYSHKHLDKLGLLLILYSILFIQPTEAWPNFKTLIPVIGVCIVIYANNNESFVTCNPISQFLGKISYSTYLWHWPIVVLMNLYKVEFNFINITLAIIASILFGWLSFTFIEDKFRNKSLLKINVSVFIVTLSLSILVIITHGMSFRYSNSIEEIVNYRFDRTLWRADSCFLNPEQNYIDFSKCSDRTNNNSIVLWGDSHAAQLMPGFVARPSREFEIYQRTSSLCGPLIGYVNPQRKNCFEVNNNISSYIAKNKPKAVILSALWSQYETEKYLPKTLTFLVENNIKNIYVIGPFPFWQDTLPNIVEKFGLTQTGEVSRKYFDDHYNVVKNDKLLRKMALKYPNVTYISPLDMMCTELSCKATVIKQKAYPIQWDSAHLSNEGSEWFVGEILQTLRR